MSLKNLKNLLLNASIVLVVAMAASGIASADDAKYDGCHFDGTYGENRPAGDCPVPTPEPGIDAPFQRGPRRCGFAAAAACAAHNRFAVLNFLCCLTEFKLYCCF